MKYFKVFTSSLLLATIPSLFLYPQNHLPQVISHDIVPFDEMQFTSYDQIIDLIHELESGELEKKYNADDQEKIYDFFIHLAEKGVLPGDEIALQKDIALLLQEDNPYQYPSWLENGDIPSTIEVVPLKHHKHKHDKHHKHHKKHGIKKFVKEHKKEIIIGAVILVAVIVAVVVIASTAGTAAAAAGAAGAAAASGSDKEKATSPPISAAEIQEELDKQIFSFKDTILKDQFFQINPQETLSEEENGRILSSLFAHDCFHNQFSTYPREMQISGHHEIDNKFSTNYTHLYTHSNQEVSFDTLSYQVRGERALEYGYYSQAVQDFGKAIELNPTNSLPYLQRSTAYFNLRDYDHSLQDFHQYASQKTYPFSTPEFCMGFAKGLPTGIYESGEGILLFLAEFATHPIHAASQMVEAITMLSNLVRSDEWAIIGEVLAPEIYQLVTQWSTLSSEERGRLAGYALGKHGADILTPGALAKVASKSVKAAQELAAIVKNIRIAEETLILEAAAGIGNSAKVAEVIQSKIVTAAEKLGFNAREIAQLENISKIEGSINNIAKSIPDATQDLNFTNHALQRAIERGVSRESILDALTSPLKIEEVKIDKFGRPSQRFIGRNAEVVINPETQQIVSVNPTSTKKFKKLDNELSNVKDRAE